MGPDVPSTLALIRRTWQQLHTEELIALPPAETVREAVEALGQHLLRTQFMLVTQLPELQVHFCSPGVETLLGCPPAEFSFEWLYARMHPDDGPLVAEATALSARFADHCRHELQGHVFSIDYRLRHQDGHWVRVLRQNFPVRLDEDGKLVLVGSIYTDITHHKVTTDIRFHFSHPGFAAWVRTAAPPEADTLSPREQAVLGLVLRGYTSQQIAEQLYVSSHTISTHRRNIGRKLGNRDLSHLLSHLDT
ncbi:transcriptional regulator, LuxR family [Hymenobacter roseosalivarius DSM 11622]|uniref:Transcriptional regulator, LuxR family n=1 Tax=Hymenobacter roseosalivarius DSM 11622 TaxID=645990 RepID=A0A1W1V436_9BACT|nr:LuxR C-terminal-related transcriptional regulator [Hymenobacter roseosalivarius]SMB88088.1 transcriptional regulator, LuxR family [Hymenobacter roseosalivarius DSM 11622]